MKVNSAKAYRQWIKSQEDRSEVDEDFIGCSYDAGDKKIKGFFNLFHGKKDDIEKYLPSLLDIAEDNQAIYEFLQNAVDCDATHFWAFYNEQYFLAVNNGTKFSLDGISSILNIAQSTKTTSSSIGRLGIGFKLAHRLVGKGNGTQELVHGNKGPIMFSWDKPEQLEALMSSEGIEYEGLDENPYLFKIAITNFPANAGEHVRNLDYEDAIVFPESELNELRSYVLDCLHELFVEDSKSFRQGTLFFIKLGENKKTLLDSDLDTLKNGIEYSMNTLKQLENICFNGETIQKKELVINEGSIDKTSERFMEIDPQYKDYDILYSFGFLPLDFTSENYNQAVSQLRQSPNFYKYFPMGDEVDNMALFIHSDSFQIEANRRKLSNHHTNCELLPDIADFITRTLNTYKENDRKKFLQLYASILLTDEPSSQEKEWMQEVFFDTLFSVLSSDIPTISGFSNHVDKVKVKEVKMNIPLTEIGLAEYEWFYWDSNHNEIIDASINEDKLGLEEWNINDIIEEANLQQLNSWLATCTDGDFDCFIAEIKATTTTNAAKQLLPQIKLFKVGDKRMSQDEIIADIDCVILTERTKSIKTILEKAGMRCTTDTLESHPLCNLLKAQEEKQLFENIKTKLEEEQNWKELTPSDKLELITCLKNFENVGEAAIKRLKIFNNLDEKQCALEYLIPFSEHVEVWQRPYIICQDENFSEIQTYLVSSDKFFSEIVEKFYKDIISSETSIDELHAIYQKNGISWPEGLSLNLIDTYGCTEEVLSIIEKNPSKTAVDKFLKKLGVLNISSKKSYPSDSFEYRCIQVAAKVESSTIRNIIKIDDTILTKFASSNELSFRCKNSQGIERTYTMKLSDILPDDTQCALYGRVADMFSAIYNYRVIFSADSSDVSNVISRLKDKLTPDNVIITPAQYIFILFTRWQSNYSSLSYWVNNNYISFGQSQSQIGKTIAQILDYAFQHNLADALVQYKLEWIWRQHVSGKYLFSSDYTIENERAYNEIEVWCAQDTQKKELLKKLDMHFEDSAEIKRRKKFKENSFEVWDGESFPNQFLAWVSSLAPIEGKIQMKLLLSICEKFPKSNIIHKDYVEDDFVGTPELNTQKYLEWKPSKSISIYLLEKEMPCRIIYNKIIISRDNVGDYHYFNDTKHLYIRGCEESEIAGVLAKVYQDNSIPLFEYRDYTSVCFDSYEEQLAKNREIEFLREEIEKLQNDKHDKSHEEESNREKERKEYEQRIRDFLGGSFSLSDYNTKSEHIIACYRILNYLINQGYIIADDFDKRAFVAAGMYKRIKLQNGTYVNPCGAKWGIWYIHPNIWRDIIDNGNWACICTGNNGSDFEIVKSIEDLKRNAKLAKNVLMRLHPSGIYDIMDVIDSVFPGNGNGNMDIHLMLKLHDTPNEEINSLFDKAFNADTNNFTLD